MVPGMKVNMWMEWWMEMEHIIGMMEKFMLVNGVEIRGKE